MIYKKPICHCGEKLIYLEDRIVSTSFKINKNGKVGKRSIEVCEGEMEAHSLYCDGCRETYAIYYDENERIIRGDRIS